MPATGVSFAGTTLIGAYSTTPGNGEGIWEFGLRKPQRPVLAPVSMYGVAGLGMKIVGQHNTPDTARRIVIGPRGSFPCWAAYTSRANALAAWLVFEGLIGTTGTLLAGLSGGESYTNMLLEDVEIGPPDYRGVGNCVCSASLAFYFVKVGP